MVENRLRGIASAQACALQGLGNRRELPLAFAEGNEPELSKVNVGERMRG